MSEVKHKVFISYHHDDQDEVGGFIETFDHERNVFIARALGVGMEQDIIDSTDTGYVMRRIRESYLKDSTVTIVLIGKCTWARRYIDCSIRTPTTLLVYVLKLKNHKIPVFHARYQYPHPI